MRRLAAAFPQGPASVTEDDLVEWLASQSWARETLRSHRAALRGYFGWAHRKGLIDADPARELPTIQASRPAPRPAPESAVLAARSNGDERVRLMVALAAYAGLRRAEIARAHSTWLIEDLGGWSLRVLGKGGRVRTVPIPEWLADAIRDRGQGWLFPGGQEGHVSPYWVGRLVGRALPDGWTTHTLRHRYATRCYSGSRDLLAVQQLLGHSKPETTTAYVALQDEWLRDAAQWAA